VRDIGEGAELIWHRGAATPAEIAGWNIDVDRDGNNLPPGSGTVGHRNEMFDQQCVVCHGAKGCRV
jgi:S-disulfanyl-L-cysteine oxidoreductase SoxD